ncbi:hypothetical protein [Paraburkholderia kururiensis]|uniref:Uncharacterized protein n=1 Tax=Paraburkholderia kururiensis TaxID=984307 RepID=A0ABZ0WLH4_9BURK|nr:hypothetical protein [Paraburkholderia kururiensis]WQD78145.1 hypothetical protein U0042_29760 [Paraburkholderia kururiensis]
MQILTYVYRGFELTMELKAVCHRAGNVEFKWLPPRAFAAAVNIKGLDTQGGPVSPVEVTRDSAAAAVEAAAVQAQIVIDYMLRATV